MSWRWQYVFNKQVIVPNRIINNNTYGNGLARIENENKNSPEYSIFRTYKIGKQGKGPGMFKPNKPIIRIVDIRQLSAIIAESQIGSKLHNMSGNS